MLAECTSCGTSKGDGNATENFETAAAANWNRRAVLPEGGNALQADLIELRATIIAAGHKPIEVDAEAWERYYNAVRAVLHGAPFVDADEHRQHFIWNGVKVFLRVP
jgi:hypothetical protein